MLFKGCMNLLNQLRLKKLFGLPVSVASLFCFGFFNLNIILFFLFGPLHINICVYMLILSEKPAGS